MKVEKKARGPFKTDQYYYKYQNNYNNSGLTMLIWLLLFVGNSW